MKPFSFVAAAIFLLVALAHLYRVTIGVPVTIGATDIGQAVSWAGLIVASVLSVGLFREALRGNDSHRIRLTAEIDAANVITLTPKIRLRRKSGGHHFKFVLDDRSGKNVQFAALTHEDNCSTFSPAPKNPGSQIYDEDTHNNDSPRWAEFKNKNNNTRPMNVSYQWEFTCDSGATVLPYDPIISNGGRV